MAKTKVYTIIVKRKRVVVTYDVYKAYHAEREHARYIEDAARNREIPMEWFREHGVNPRCIHTALTPPDILVRQEQMDKLNEALRSLPVDERWLIHALFFERKTERQVAKDIGLSQPVVNKRKRRILAKLKKVMDI